MACQMNRSEPRVPALILAERWRGDGFPAQMNVPRPVVSGIRAKRYYAKKAGRRSPMNFKRNGRTAPGPKEGGGMGRRTRNRCMAPPVAGFATGELFQA